MFDRLELRDLLTKGTLPECMLWDTDLLALSVHQPT